MQGGGSFGAMFGRTIVGAFRQQKSRVQHILGTPGGPVAHGFTAAPHPPEMLIEIGFYDAVFQLMANALCDEGGNCIQLFLQQIQYAGQLGTGFTGKQIHHRAGGIRQNLLRAIAPIGVVGRKLPGALLTQGEDAVYDVVQKASAVFNAFRHHQGVEGMSFGKINILKIDPVAGALKRHEVRGANGGKALPQTFLAQGN